MKIHKTKYATLTTEELLSMAESRTPLIGELIRPLFLELIYRLEETRTELTEARAELLVSEEAYDALLDAEQHKA